MIRTNGFLGFLLLSVLMLSYSCRKEESIFVGEIPEDRLVVNSNVANLLTRVASKDGSDDNIIDGASCISIQLPLTVIFDNTEIIVDGPEDYDTLESLIDNDGEDQNGQLEIIFPITVVSKDYSETLVADAYELQALADACQSNGDDDIECIDIVYPVNISIFNTIRELFDSVLLQNDEMFYGLVTGLDVNSIASIAFPVKVKLSNGSEETVLNLNGLENIIELSKDDCDENDVTDFENEDCIGCNYEELLELWATCSKWKAHKFKLDGNDIKKQYEELVFHFMQDGTVLATSDTESFNGTWQTNGMDNNTTFTIAIPGLEDFNAVWNLKEIKLSKKPDVRLEIGEDELHIQWTCEK